MEIEVYLDRTERKTKALVVILSEMRSIFFRVELYWRALIAPVMDPGRTYATMQLLWIVHSFEGIGDGGTKKNLRYMG